MAAGKERAVRSGSSCLHGLQIKFIPQFGAIPEYTAAYQFEPTLKIDTVGKLYYRQNDVK
jgi:hypothetical protein